MVSVQGLVVRIASLTVNRQGRVSESDSRPHDKEWDTVAIRRAHGRVHCSSKVLSLEMKSGPKLTGFRRAALEWRMKRMCRPAIEAALEDVHRRRALRRDK
jgi:hypothetical protein